MKFDPLVTRVVTKAVKGAVVRLRVRVLLDLHSTRPLDWGVMTSLSRLLTALFLSTLLLTSAAQTDTEGELAGEYNEAFYILESLNEGLTLRGVTPSLQTPQSTLEHFCVVG